MNIAYSKMAQFVPRKTIAKERFDGEFTIIANGRGDIEYLSNVAQTIWLNIDGSNCLNDIANIIKTEYDVPADVAESDLVEYTRDLQWKGFVTLTATNKE